MPRPLAYLLTWTTYGTWLSGDDRGSVVKRGSHTTPFTEPQRGLSLSDRSKLKHPPIRFRNGQRSAVQTALEEHCAFRSWNVHALNVRTNHVHLVVSASIPPERVMTECKGRATRVLRERGLIGASAKVWTRHGSTRYLNSTESVDGSVRYVRDGQ
ncbi:MAG: transposase [Phycisphaerales bacterium JB040]